MPRRLRVRFPVGSPRPPLQAGWGLFQVTGSPATLTKTGTTTSADVTFTLGTASTIDLPAQYTGDRINCGYFHWDRLVPYGYIPSVGFDTANRRWTYDGTGSAEVSSTQYMIGVENGPYNNHWQWPPTPVTTLAPAMIGGVLTSRSLQNQQKHVFAIWCPNDSKIRFFYGDFTAAGDYPGSQEQTGRPVIWALDPFTSTWTWDNANVKGSPGDKFPGSPDIWGGCYLPDLGKVFLMPGKHRGIQGLSQDDVQWKAAGGLADFVPAGALNYEGNDTGGENEQRPDHVFAFLWNPVTHKHELVPGGVYLTGAGGAQNNGGMCAYDSADKRIYSMYPYVSYITLWWRDATTLNTTGWQSQVITSDVVPSGTGRDHPITVNRWLVCDVTGRRLLYMDWGSGVTGDQFFKPAALMAITLPGHGAGAWKLQVVREYPEFGTVYERPPNDTVIAGSSLDAWALIPEKRKLVMFSEPNSFGNGGPGTKSWTVDIDTGDVTAGPRLPSLDGIGRPYLPQIAVWIPTTQELFVGGYQAADARAGSVQTYHRYQWIDGADNPHPVNPWSYTPLTVAVRSGNVVELGVGNDTISAHDPGPGIYTGVGGQGAVTAFSGMAYAPDYGTQGGIAVTGGGHGDYGGNEVYVYDIAQGAWTRINQPSIGLAGPNGPYYAYTDATYQSVTSPPGPVSSHTYDNLRVIPGGSAGQLLIYQLGAMAWVGGNDGEYAYVCDLATGVWSRFSSNAIPNAGGGGNAYRSSRNSCYDAGRNRVWGSGTKFTYLDLSTKTFSLAVNAANRGNYSCSCAVPVHDLMLVIGRNDGTNTVYLEAWDLTNYLRVNASGPTWLKTQGDPLPNPANYEGYGFDWDTARDVGYVYLGSVLGAGFDDRNHVWKITPPASDYLNSAWTVTKITLPLSFPYSGTAIYGRWKYIPSLGKFALLSGNTTKLSFYTP